jgi:NCAIR mutase (PurE)-related protein
MDHNRVRKLLENVSAGKVTVDDALGKLRSLPYEDLGFARLDSHRSLRQGFPEVVFCEGKTPEQLTLITRQMLAAGGPIMFTRANLEAYQTVNEVAPEAVYYEDASIVVVNSEPIESILSSGTVLVVTGGTTDIPVAEEAAVTAEIMGNKVDRMYDVGVAGLPRLLDELERLFAANVLVVVAGMEGALASVVGGLVAAPVIAVPTSVGYGASFGGLAALLTMLNSCAPGVATVNIDNGFGAGYLAGMINRMSEGEK